jgi:hypothetical protein
MGLRLGPCIRGGDRHDDVIPAQAGIVEGLAVQRTARWTNGPPPGHALSQGRQAGRRHPRASGDPGVTRRRANGEVDEWPSAWAPAFAGATSMRMSSPRKRGSRGDAPSSERGGRRMGLRLGPCIRGGDRHDDVIPAQAGIVEGLAVQRTARWTNGPPPGPLLSQGRQPGTRRRDPVSEARRDGQAMMGPEGGRPTTSSTWRT